MIMTKQKQEKIFMIRNDHDKASVMQAISRITATNEKVYMVKVSLDEEKRRGKQNRLSFLWYDLLGSMTGHGKDHERNLCKLHNGIPILREDGDFNAYCEQVLDVLPYEAQVLAMEYMDVTKLMTVREFSNYLNTVDQRAVNNGYQLPHPDDLYYEALMQDRPND